MVSVCHFLIHQRHRFKDFKFEFAGLQYLYRPVQTTFSVSSFLLCAILNLLSELNKMYIVRRRRLGLFLTSKKAETTVARGSLFSLFLEKVEVVFIS